MQFLKGLHECFFLDQGIYKESPDLEVSTASGVSDYHSYVRQTLYDNEIRIISVSSGAKQALTEPLRVPPAEAPPPL